ncbi:MAG TPA: EAL domain-containing protein [Clostridia bacterium]
MKMTPTVTIELVLLITSIAFLLRVFFIMTLSIKKNIYSWLLLWFAGAVASSCLRLLQDQSGDSSSVVFYVKLANFFATSYMPFVAVRFVHAYMDRKLSQGISTFLNLIQMLFAVLLFATPWIITDKAEIKTTVFNETVLRVPLGKFAMVAAVFNTLFVLWLAFILLKEKGTFQIEFRVLACGFLMTPFLMMNDILLSYLHIPWMVRMSDFAYISLGFSFDIAFFYSFIKVHERLEEAVAERTSELAATNEELSNTNSQLEESQALLEEHIAELTDREARLKESEERIRKLAFFDEITGCPNRFQLVEWAEDLSPLMDGCKLAVLLIDVDNFRYINEYLGHETGDIFLAAIAERIRQLQKERSIVARLSGKQFVYAVWLGQDDNESDEASILCSAFSKPISANSTMYTVSITIGVSTLPLHGKDINEVLKKAGISLNYAKQFNRHKFAIFNDRLKKDTERKFLLETELATAMENGEFHLCYQPQLDLKANNIRGFEALLRWENPVLGNVSPAEFIPVAEETGHINSIGAWVIHEVYRKAVMFRNTLNTNLVFSINISPIQLFSGELPELLQKLVDTLPDLRDIIEFEITESRLIASSNEIMKTLNYFKAMGIKLALDDFGTGYSSLSYLKSMPFDVLKIDKSFVSGDDPYRDAYDITRNIVDLAHKLNLEVIAEGVETKEQLKRLTQYDCDHIQGYYFGRPMGEKQMEKFITKYKTIKESLDKK